MKRTRWAGDYGNYVISCGSFFKAVRAAPDLRWHRVIIWRLNVWRSPHTGKVLFWRWMKS